MNFNANGSTRQGLGRKVKRVSDVNAMGYSPYNNAMPQPNLYPNVAPDVQTPTPLPEYNIQQPYMTNQNPPNFSMHQINNPPNIPAMNQPYSNIPPQFGAFGQNLVQDMAMQYGQQLTTTGKTILQNEVQKYVPVTSLKYYFAVDTKYVVSKLMLLFFPFTHKDWSIKYEQDGPVQPRFEVNAPDLYIPSMAYVTYVLVAGMVLGMQKRFSPEQIGILASSAMAWLVVELAVYSCTLYITNIKTSLRTLDLLAYSGYKFVGIIISILISLLGGTTAYYVSLLYISAALAFFLVRNLKAQVLISDNTAENTSYYGNDQVHIGSKRRLYFLLFLAGVQPVLSWWLSFHLVGHTQQTNINTDL